MLNLFTGLALQVTQGKDSVIRWVMEPVIKTILGSRRNRRETCVGQVELAKGHTGQTVVVVGTHRHHSPRALSRSV